MILLSADKEASTQSQKINLLGLSPEKLIVFFKNIGEKPFRATQVLKWIHQIGVDDLIK